jgi:hypothetical protein
MTYYRNWISGKQILLKVGRISFSIRGVFSILVVITLILALSVVYYRASHPF